MTNVYCTLDDCIWYKDYNKCSKKSILINEQYEGKVDSILPICLCYYKDDDGKR